MSLYKVEWGEEVSRFIEQMVKQLDSFRQSPPISNHAFKQSASTARTRPGLLSKQKLETLDNAPTIQK
ncbi:MAG: hypothetical protein QXH12_08085 [Candidatus Caldarchaeum sp.]